MHPAAIEVVGPVYTKRQLSFWKNQLSCRMECTKLVSYVWTIGRGKDPQQLLLSLYPTVLFRTKAAEGL